MLKDFQIFSFPGGFSYGDDTGSGKALANRIKNNLFDEIMAFIDRDTLMLGICNGFQVMVSLGVVPGLSSERGKVETALEHNTTFRYQCRWVDLKVGTTPSVFTRGIQHLHLPVAHGEGNFFASPEVMKTIESDGLAVMRYSKPDGSPAEGEFPYNPNGAMKDIASICDKSGRLMGMMPHPERAIFFSQRDDWPSVREKYRREGRPVPEENEGILIFRNAVHYFS